MTNKAASETLDTTNAVRPVWLVKVPRFVTQGWAAAAENGNDGTAVVGRVRMEVDPSLLSADNPNPKAEVTIHLNDAATAAATSTAASAVPEQLVLAPQGESDDTGTLHVMCRRDTATPPTSSCEGKVSHRFDARPRLSEAGDEAVTIDEKYRLLSRKRKNEAEHKDRQVVFITKKDALRTREALRPTAVGFGAQSREERREVKEAAVKVRMERQELQTRLFKLFEEKRLWYLTELTKATNQPNAWLKEVLQEVANQVKRGPDAGKWEIKDEYRAS